MLPAISFKDNRILLRFVVPYLPSSPAPTCVSHTFPTRSSSLPLTCPYRCRLLTCIFFDTSITPVIPIVIWITLIVRANIRMQNRSVLRCRKFLKKIVFPHKSHVYLFVARWELYYRLLFSLLKLELLKVNVSVV